ncbi:unnamed protein product, partial [Ceratitis capitata]
LQFRPYLTMRTPLQTAYFQNQRQSPSSSQTAIEGNFSFNLNFSAQVHTYGDNSINSIPPCQLPGMLSPRWTIFNCISSPTLTVLLCAARVPTVAATSGAADAIEAVIGT